MRLTRRKFDELVREALESLPDEFLDRLDNVDVLVREQPTRTQMQEQGLGAHETLFGLYEGVPLTHRNSYGNVLPDRITIFQRPIEMVCETREEIVEQVRKTVVHEIAHFFGMDDDALDDMGLG